MSVPIAPVVKDTHVWRQRQLDLNGGNGLAPVSIEKPLVALFEAGADPEIPI
jgi:hypothetical protein